MWAGGTHCGDAISVFLGKQHFTPGCQEEGLQNKCSLFFILVLLLDLCSFIVSLCSGGLVVEVV